MGHYVLSKLESKRSNSWLLSVSTSLWETFSYGMLWTGWLLTTKWDSSSASIFPLLRSFCHKGSMFEDQGERKSKMELPLLESLEALQECGFMYVSAGQNQTFWPLTVIMESLKTSARSSRCLSEPYPKITHHSLSAYLPDPEIICESLRTVFSSLCSSWSQFLPGNFQPHDFLHL